MPPTNTVSPETSVPSSLFDEVPSADPVRAREPEAHGHLTIKTGKSKPKPKNGNGSVKNGSEESIVEVAPEGTIDETLAANVTKEYTADSIRVLEGRDAVRQRPAMYIGDTGGNGLHHLFFEILDNAIDEVLAGRATTIDVVIHKDKSISVRDDGNGIPTGINKATGLTGVEIAMTKLHGGGKFGDGGYKVSGGLHGVGLSCVNFLSSWCQADILQSGGHFVFRCESGLPLTNDVKKIGKSTGHGTTIHWMADPAIFGTYDYKPDIFISRIRNTCYLNREVKITFRDECYAEGDEIVTQEFHFQRGIAEFVEHLNETKDTAGFGEVIYFQKTREQVQVEIALQYNGTYTEQVLSFANNVHTKEGGTHLSGFRTALTRVLNQYARKNGYIKEGKDPNLSGDDVREGLTAIVSVRLTNPQFEGQTKGKLGNMEVEGIVNSITGEGLSQYLEEHPNAAKRIIDKALTAQRARDAARKAAELIKRAGALEYSSLPGKLADCSERDPSKCEIYLVEGDSAGGCFSGETQIALADGRNVSFLELVSEQEQGREHFVYTIRADGTVGLERGIHAGLTKRAARVVRVTLDNGEAITCTPDHRFMLRDGSYRPASELMPGVSLMPLYRKMSDKAMPGVTISGYEMTWNPKSETWLFTYKISDKFELPVVAKASTQSPMRTAEAIANYNHRIVSVEQVDERIDVYDLEVPGTHNFALASGVFVHNSAKSGRDRRTQAILPLRGKIINVGKAALDKTLENNEVKSLIMALGTGIKIDSDEDESEETSSKFDLTRLRYHRIIIMTDADVDGDHIRTLLLTFFFQYMRPLIERGHIYIAQPPLYSIKAGKDKRLYARSSEERDDIIKKLKRKDVQVGRFKGLGEMNAEELYDTTMNVESRTIGKVNLEDAERAADIFNILMSDKVEPRKNFIIRYAKEATNVDWHC